MREMASKETSPEYPPQIQYPLIWRELENPKLFSPCLRDVLSHPRDMGQRHGMLCTLQGCPVP